MLLLTLQPSVAPAFVLLNPFRKWLSQDIPAAGVPFIIDNQGEDSVTVADGSADNGLTEVIGSVQFWNNAVGRPIVAAPMPTSIMTFNTTDGLNSIVFNDPGGICGGSCLAATFVARFDSSDTETTNGITFNNYTETDITFNATVNWTTHADAASPSCTGEFDIEGIAIHEVGHALGVGHSNDLDATMFAFTSSCNPTQIPLDPDDVAAARCQYLHGAGCGGCENCPVVLGPLALACGAAPFTFMNAGIWPLGGNLVRFESPQGFEHIQLGSLREGYIMCYSGGGGVAYDLTYDSAGFFDPSISQPSGPGTFPLEFFRTTTDGLLQLRQRFTGNSFVATGNGSLDLNGDGLLCNVPGECGNCTNRTVHLLMEVTNLSASPINNVVLVRAADLKVDSQPAANRFIRTADSVTAWVDSEGGETHHGVLMQGITGAVPPESLVQTIAQSEAINCNVTSVATPATGTFVGKLRWPLGTLAPGETKQVRMHYRRW
ncbi:MAG: matrixin family metalloprotease [Candidatus Binatia bacterium]